jgi:tRNA-2-methylthio-N6-dimethylallyladenosine synthase
MDQLREARRLMPGIAITTDIIVGFPGETEEDFEQTLAIASEAKFDLVFAFIFSPREGTEAALMTEHFIEPEVVSSNPVIILSRVLFPDPFGPIIPMISPR